MKKMTRQMLWARIGQRAYKSQALNSRFHRDLEAAYGVTLDDSESARELAFVSARGRASRGRNALPYENVAERYSVAVKVMKGILG